MTNYLLLLITKEDEKSIKLFLSNFLRVLIGIPGLHNNKKREIYSVNKAHTIISRHKRIYRY